MNIIDITGRVQPIHRYDIYPFSKPPMNANVDISRSPYTRGPYKKSWWFYINCILVIAGIYYLYTKGKAYFTKEEKQSLPETHNADSHVPDLT